VIPVNREAMEHTVRAIDTVTVFGGATL